MSSASDEDVVFAQTQIGKGVKPLAQHGAVVVGANGALSLYDDGNQMIDMAPFAEVTLKRMIITGGQTISLTMQGRKYNVTPGWGTGDRDVLGTSSAAKALVTLVRSRQGQG